MGGRVPAGRLAPAGHDGLVSGVADEIEARLNAAAQAAREHDRAAARAEELRTMAAAQADEVAAARLRAAEEQRRVARLAGWTPVRILAGLRGVRKDRLAQARARADAARLTLARAEAQLAALRQEQESVEVRLRELAGAPAAYAAALAEKERLVRAAGDARAARLLALAEERDTLTGELRDLAEAGQAAEAAAEALGRVSEALGSAQKWSAYDTFFGGGAPSSAIKHRRLRRAADAAAEADRHLALLRGELADLDAPPAVTSHLVWNRRQKLVDIWVDRVIDDMATHEGIKQARRRVAETVAQVEQVRAGLRQRAESARQRLDRLETERRDILAGTSPE